MITVVHSRIEPASVFFYRSKFFKTVSVTAEIAILAVVIFPKGTKTCLIHLRGVSQLTVTMRKATFIAAAALTGLHEFNAQTCLTKIRSSLEFFCAVSKITGSSMRALAVNE